KQLLVELSADGVAILLSSHQIGEIEDACGRFTVLREGRVVWDGTANELRAQAPGSAYLLVTSDDRRALEIAEHRQGVRALSRSDGVGLTVSEGALDGYALALGAAGIAIRRLELLVSPLESMFFALTGDASTTPEEPAELIERAM